MARLDGLFSHPGCRFCLNHSLQPLRRAQQLGGGLDATLPGCFNRRVLLLRHMFQSEGGFIGLRGRPRCRG